MNRYFLLLIICAFLIWNPSSNAGGPPGSLGEADGTNSNPHNLSSAQTRLGATKALTDTQICIFCHVPHGANLGTPLWGRLPPVGPMGGFKTLTNPALKIAEAGIVGTTLYDSASGDYPNGASKLCLSCHDGVTAMGILANGTDIDMSNTGTVTGTAIIDLEKSHPISFVYNSTVQLYLGGSYKWPTSANLETDSVGKTWAQCTICHQPHQDTNNGTTYKLPFWRGAGNNEVAEYDAVCQACHTATPGRTEHAYP